MVSVVGISRWRVVLDVMEMRRYVSWEVGEVRWEGEVM
jgi:hypothetical protein